MTNPIDKVAFGNVSIAVFENTRKNKDGIEFTKPSFKVQKSYKAEDGTWKTTNNLDLTELMKLGMAINKVVERQIKVGVATATTE